ncbi:four helix bundle protein [uncultured Mucilaginibacter sp.]|uniref:four helix bundle protein n=1 Tax=uncultured Mucilaginibacter sp. TaxID=797541 RepID=UPI0025D0A3A8|nr:four helix bundle protein [uncultured Mucilaginibacter sp.]
MKFRFEDLKIWQKAIEVSNELFDLADQLETNKQFRFAEQFRSATLSISNNIAEGSGSRSDSDFKNFLNFSHRSTFEVVNMLIVFEIRKYISPAMLEKKKEELDHLSRMIMAFSKTL